MYCGFYGLIGEPFRTTPDADAVYFSPSHREALSSILYGIKERKGVIVVTGEVGVGKTTILRRYLQTAAPLSQKTIHIYNPNISFDRVLMAILTQLGANPGGDAADMLRHLHELALAEQARGSTIVLVIDEAQCIPPETLEGIRMLSNVETANEKLIQIVLMGQPELEAVLERHDLRHVRERIAVRTKILPLTPTESADYIHHRLMQVSREQRSIFSSGALTSIIKAAEGIPRRLNILCDNALIAGYRRRQPIVTRRIAKQVVADMHGIPSSPWWNRRTAVGVAVSVALVTAITSYLGLNIGASPQQFSAADPNDDRPNAASRPEYGASSDESSSGSEQKAPTDALRRSTPAESSAAPNEALYSESGSSPPPPPGPDHQETRVAQDEPAPGDQLEASETARLLAVLMDCGRVVLGKAQPTINNPRVADKGFTSAIFEGRLGKEFQTRTGHDLRSLPSSPMPERAKPLLLKLAAFMVKEVRDVQPDINKKGIGFKGFIPATFATRVAEKFSKDTGLTLRQIGPPGTAPRNPGNRPDEREQAALFVMQKSHPRVGDHIVEQQIEDRGMRVLLPLFYTKACLACHGQPKGQVDISGYEKEGFKEGDIGGAISVMVPVAAQQLKADTAR